MLALLLSTQLAQATADRAYTLAGEWNCGAGLHGTVTTLAFSRTAQGLAMVYRYADARGPHELDGSLEYDPARMTWTLDEPASSLEHFRGSALPWSGQLWQFRGETYPPDMGGSMLARIEPASVTFIAFGGDELEMLRSQWTGGQWVSHDPWTSAVIDATCTRSNAGERGIEPE